jgi:adenosylmethionine-8-amino-7-oxononanoate aminotransferase
VNALRHHPKLPMFVTGQAGQKWKRQDGSELLNLSGASLTQSLLPVADSAVLEHMGSVTPSSGFESPLKISAEQAVLKRLPWAEALLWASTGSDAIEQAIWAIDTAARAEQGSGLRTVFVRSGGYHGNTLLGRALSSRENAEASFRALGALQVEVLDEIRGPRSVDFLESLQRRWQQRGPRLPALVLIEPFPTAGIGFVPDIGRLNALLEWCAEQGIYVVFDEIACGSYRHGVFSICDRLKTGLHPDGVVLSKGLTCGAYPLSTFAMSSRLNAEVREQKKKALSFTYGLTDCGAAVMLNTLDRYEELERKGAFVERAAGMRALGEKLAELGLEIEYTTTTVRIAGPSQAMAELADRLLRDSMWTYMARAALRIDAQRRDVGFIHVCPPFDLPVSVLSAQCDALYESIAQVVSPAQI